MGQVSTGRGYSTAHVNPCVAWCVVVAYRTISRPPDNAALAAAVYGRHKGADWLIRPWGWAMGGQYRCRPSYMTI